MKHEFETLKMIINLTNIELCKRVIESEMNFDLDFHNCRECISLLYVVIKSNNDEISLEIIEFLIVKEISIEDIICEL